MEKNKSRLLLSLFMIISLAITGLTFCACGEKEKVTLMLGNEFNEYLYSGENIQSITFDYNDKDYEQLISGATPIDVGSDDADDRNKVFMYKVKQTEDVNSPIDVYVLSKFEIYTNAEAINMFSNLTNLTSITFKNFNTSKAKRMNHMFLNCSSLEVLHVNKFKTGNTQSMVSMFEGCSSLKTLNLSSFNTKKVYQTGSMFKNCSSLESINLLSFNTSNLQTMSAMFSGCSSLTSLNLSNFNTREAWRMNEMFKDCTSLTSLDLSSFHTFELEASGMFSGCTMLETIYVSNRWKPNHVGGLNIFKDCVNLVGGNGTVYNSEYVNREYARVDSAEAPGYLTFKSI